MLAEQGKAWKTQGSQYKPLQSERAVEKGEAVAIEMFKRVVRSMSRIRKRDKENEARSEGSYRYVCPKRRKKSKK